jgi:hypothetical protein
MATEPEPSNRVCRSQEEILSDYDDSPGSKMSLDRLMLEVATDIRDEIAALHDAIIWHAQHRDASDS